MLPSAVEMKRPHVRRSRIAKGSGDRLLQGEKHADDAFKSSWRTYPYTKPSPPCRDAGECDMNVRALLSYPRAERMVEQLTLANVRTSRTCYSP